MERVAVGYQRQQNMKPGYAEDTFSKDLHAERGGSAMSAAEWAQGDTIRIGLLPAGTIIEAVDGLRWVVIGDGQNDTVLVKPHNRKGERDYFQDDNER